MAKYEVKDINKNGVEDAWEIAKYAKANAAAEGSPTKMIGGIAGAMAQQTGALAASPPQQMTNVPPAASSLINPFSPQAQQNAQGIYGGVAQRQNSVGATPMFQTNQLGNTQDEQAKLNSEENNKQVKFAKEFNDYTIARKNKSNWEDTENNFGFGDKEYPQQKQLDSLKTVYRNKQL